MYMHGRAACNDMTGKYTTASWTAMRMNGNGGGRAGDAATAHKHGSGSSSTTTTTSSSTPSSSSAVAAQRVLQMRLGMCNDDNDVQMHNNTAPVSSRRAASESNTLGAERSNSSTAASVHNNNNVVVTHSGRTYRAQQQQHSNNNHCTTATTSASINSNNSTSTHDGVTHGADAAASHQHGHALCARLRPNALDARACVSTAPDKPRVDRGNHGSVATPAYHAHDTLDKRSVLLPGSALSHTDDNKAVLPRAVWLSNNNSNSVSSRDNAAAATPPAALVERPPTASNVSAFFSLFSPASPTPSLQDLAGMPHAQLSEDNVYKLSRAHKVKTAAPSMTTTTTTTANTNTQTTTTTRRTSGAHAGVDKTTSKLAATCRSVPSSKQADVTTTAADAAAATTTPLTAPGSMTLSPPPLATTTTTATTGVLHDVQALVSLERTPHNDLLRVQSATVYAGSVRSMATPTTTQQVCTVMRRKDGNGNKYINQYRIVRELGRGECGKVKLAYDEVAQRLVAIKQVRRADTQRQRLGGMTAAQRSYLAFLREVNIMQNLHHHNIAPVYEIIDDPTADKVYLVMKYIERGPIARIEVKAGTDVVCTPIAPDELAQLLLQILTGLEYLHRHDIVHRDIKPDNILRDRDGQVFLVDFGVAETFDTTYRARMETRKTQSMARSMAMSIAGECASGPVVLGVKGTLLFIAPELWTRQRSYGKPVDMWAVGVTLFTLLTGRLPFRNLTEVSDATLPVIPATYGAVWQELLHGMFERDPARRLTVQQARALVKTRLLGSGGNVRTHDGDSAAAAAAVGSGNVATTMATAASSSASDAVVPLTHDATSAVAAAASPEAAAAAATRPPRGSASTSTGVAVLVSAGARRGGVVYDDMTSAMAHEQRMTSPVRATAAVSPAVDTITHDSDRMPWLLDAPFTSVWSLNSLCSNITSTAVMSTATDVRDWRASTGAGGASNGDGSGTSVVVVVGRDAPQASGAPSGSSASNSSSSSSNNPVYHSSNTTSSSSSTQGAVSSTSLLSTSAAAAAAAAATAAGATASASTLVEMSSVVSQAVVPGKDAASSVLPACRLAATRATQLPPSSSPQALLLLTSDAAISRNGGAGVPLTGVVAASPVMATMSATSRKSSGVHATFTSPHGVRAAEAQLAPHHSGAGATLHSLLMPPTLQRRSARSSAYSLHSLPSCPRNVTASALRSSQKQQMSTTQKPPPPVAPHATSAQPPPPQASSPHNEQSQQQQQQQVAVDGTTAVVDDDDDAVQIQQMQLPHIDFDTSVGDEVDRFMVSAYTTSSQANASNASGHVTTVGADKSDDDDDDDSSSSGGGCNDSASSSSSSSSGTLSDVLLPPCKSLLSMPSL